jgi:sugar O-acyltransferase (sialic acid O-acetyltransferase NeuD family)
MRPLVIFGAGGLAQEAIWVAEAVNADAPLETRWDILGYLSDDPSQHGTTVYGYPVLAGPPPSRGATLWYHCAVGSNDARERAAGRLGGLGLKAATLVHPSVIQARGAEVGEGTYIGAGTILSPNAKVGCHVLINQRVLVGHDVTMSDFSQACPGAALSGGSRVGKGALIGTNASIYPRQTVGEYAVVGSNSYVIRRVAPRTTVLGVPAQVVAVRPG